MEIPTEVAPLGDSAMAKYRAMYELSIKNPSGFWAEQARAYLKWFVDFDLTTQGGFLDGDIAWFLNGKLNASACCIDQHLPARADQVAIIWEGDEPGECKHITYSELLKGVCRIANAMKASGIQKGDIVMIYMPMVRLARVACQEDERYRSR